MAELAPQRYFQFHCTETGRRLGGYQCGSPCTALEFDAEAGFVYAGDQSGQITVLKCDRNGVQVRRRHTFEFAFLRNGISQTGEN